MTEVINLPYQEQRNLANFNERPREYKPQVYTRKYTQNWPAYNQAQTREKFLFMQILNDIVNSLHIKTYGKSTGRPPFQIDDMIKCCAIKVFNNFSARRTISDLGFARALRYIEKEPHFNSIINYMGNPYITRFLKEMIKKTSIPLAPFEKRFAADGTGFGAPNKSRWINIRLERKKHKDYKKLHAICGTYTNIIVSAKVTRANKNDSLQFKELLKEIAEEFNIKEVSADKGYISRENAQAVADLGAIPYIMPRKNVKATAKGHYPAWHKMIRLFKDHENRFLAHYHQRSNIESTFSMIKSKFSPYIKNKKFKSQENEILLKVVCHNISVLISAIFELNLNLSIDE